MIIKKIVLREVENRLRDDLLKDQFLPTPDS